VHVHEHAQEALDFFQLSKEKLGKGYYYSIAELVSIYLTKTKLVATLSPCPRVLLRAQAP